MAKILSICADEGLRVTREILLRKTGAEITSADIATGIQLAGEQRFDLLVIGHTLTAEQAIQVADIFRQRWLGAKILHLGSPVAATGRAGIPFDSGIDWTEGPEVFLRTSRRLLRLAARSAHSPANSALEITSGRRATQ